MKPSSFNSTMGTCSPVADQMVNLVELHQFCALVGRHSPSGISFALITAISLFTCVTAFRLITRGTSDYIRINRIVCHTGL